MQATALNRFRALLLLAAFSLLVLAALAPPARACSCEQLTTEQMADGADFVFIGTEVGRVQTDRTDWDNVRVTFTVDEWLSHADGPAEFQAWTGPGDGDCGVSPLQGRFAVFTYGDVDDASMRLCGSIRDVLDATATFEARVVPAFPVPFDEVPPLTTTPGSYVDLVVPATVFGLGGAGLAALATTIRRRRDETVD